MDTDSLYLVLAEDFFYECILLIKQVEWNENEAKIVETTSEQMRKTFFPVLAAVKISNISRENQDCSRRSSDAPKCCAFLVKHFAVTMVKVKSISLAVKE